jgi:zinc protease
MATSDTIRRKASGTGEHEAFEELVRRYQGFVASLAYSDTGDFALSEDIAQQVFLTAWQRQSELRDPGHIAAWLAGIARNLLRRAYRSRCREAAARTNLALASPTQQVTPAEQAIKQEEQRLLWSILEQIPANYREPLILYYREQHSVAEVALLLRLSEEAVKQRLARGRKMIRQEVARFVEDTLQKTRPGARFTATVLASLPIANKTAGAAAGALFSKVLASLSLANLGAGLGTLGGFGAAGLSHWHSLRRASSRVERRVLWLFFLLAVALAAGEMGIETIAPIWFPAFHVSGALGMVCWGLFAGLWLGLIVLWIRLEARVKAEHGTAEERRSLQQWGYLPWCSPRWFARLVPLSMLLAMGQLAVFAAIARDGAGALCLVGIGLAWAALLGRWARACRDPDDQWRCMLVLVWALGIAYPVAFLLRGTLWKMGPTWTFAWGSFLLCGVISFLIWWQRAQGWHASRQGPATFDREDPVTVKEKPMKIGRKILALLVIAGVSAPILLASGNLLLPTQCSAAVKEFRLDNGLRVALRPVAGASDVAVVVLFDVGQTYDPQGKSGLAHLVEHLYVTAATPTTPQRSADGFMQEYPRGWNAQTGTDYTVVAAVVSPDKLEGEIADAAERMSKLRIEQADLDRELPRLEQELSNMYGRVPALAGRNQARQLLCPLPNGGRHGGLPEQIKQITLEDVRRHWNDYYKAGNARVVIAGKIDVAAVEPKIRQVFADVPRGRPLPARPKLPAARFEQSQIASAGQSAGATVCLAYRCPPPDAPLFPAFLVLAAQLEQNAMQLAGNPQEFPVIFAPLDDCGILYVSSQTKEGETAAQAIERRSQFVAKGVQPKDIAQAVAAAKQQFAFHFGTAEVPDLALGNNIYGAAFVTGRREQLGINPEKLIRAMDQVNGETIQQCAKEYFAIDRRSVAIVEKQ